MIDLKEMLNMALNSTKIINANIQIIKVPGGWIYNYANPNWKLITSTFVEEPYIPETELKEVKINNVTAEKPHTNIEELPVEEIHYIIHWQDSFGNARKNKMFSFSNEKHYENWCNKWIDMGNKIIGCYPCDSEGNLICDLKTNNTEEKQ